MLANLLARTRDGSARYTTTVLALLGTSARAVRLLEQELGDQRGVRSDLAAVDLTRYPPGLISALARCSSTAPSSRPPPTAPGRCGSPLCAPVMRTRSARCSRSRCASPCWPSSDLVRRATFRARRAGPARRRCGCGRRSRCRERSDVDSARRRRTALIVRRCRRRGVGDRRRGARDHPRRRARDGHDDHHDHVHHDDHGNRRSPADRPAPGWSSTIATLPRWPDCSVRRWSRRSTTRPRRAPDRPGPPDVVIELKVEGISRLMAVVHSQDVAQLGPIRSARTSDPDLLAMFVRPIVAWSGGNPTVTRIMARTPWIQSLNPGPGAGCLLAHLDQAGAAQPGRRREPALRPRGPATRAARSAVRLPGRGCGPRRPAGARIRPVRRCVAVELGVGVRLGHLAALGQRRAQTVEGGPQISATNVVVLATPYGTSVADPISPEAQTLGSGTPGSSPRAHDRGAVEPRGAGPVVAAHPGRRQPDPAHAGHHLGGAAVPRLGAPAVRPGPRRPAARRLSRILPRSPDPAGRPGQSTPAAMGCWASSSCTRGATSVA